MEFSYITIVQPCEIWFQSAKSKITMLQLTFSKTKIQMVTNYKIFHLISHEEQKYYRDTKTYVYTEYAEFCQ